MVVHIVKDLSWFNTIPSEGKVYQAKFRYREKDNLVELKFLEDGKMQVLFKAPVRAVTPGQACVIYDNEYCLGGGIIETVYMNGEKRKY